MGEHRLRISVSSYTAVLSTAVVALLSIHLILYVYNYQVEEVPWLLLQLFDLDEENNIPTWFSSFLLLNNAFILYLIASQENTTHKKHWLLLAIGFLILAVDEVAGMHESFNSAIDSNWAIYGGILVLLVALSFLPFLMALPRKLMILFIISGVLFVSGAIVTELLSEDMDSDSLAYMLAVALEEGLEMFGALMFLIVNLRNQAESGKLNIKVQLDERE